MPYDIIEPEQSGGYEVLEPEQPQQAVAEQPFQLFQPAQPNFSGGVFQPSQFSSGGSVIDPGGDSELTKSLGSTILPHFRPGAKTEDMIANVITSPIKAMSIPFQFVPPPILEGIEEAASAVGNMLPLAFNQPPIFEPGKKFVPDAEPLSGTQLPSWVETALNVIPSTLNQAGEMATPGNVAMALAGSAMAKRGGAKPVMEREIPNAIQPETARPVRADSQVPIRTSREATQENRSVEAGGGGKEIATQAEIATELGLVPEGELMGRWQFSKIDPKDGQPQTFTVKAGTPKEQIAARANEVADSFKESKPLGESIKPTNSVAKEVAAETGFTLVEKPQAAGAQIPTPEQLAKYTPAERAMMEEILAKYPPEWEFTDKRPGSPTPGRTFRAPVGSDKATILESYKKSVPESVSAEKPLNPGGALKDLPPELQAKSNSVQDAMRADFDALKAKQTPKPVVEVKEATVAVPEAIGMGAMKEGELAPAKPFQTSNKNATVDAERKARGLPPMMEVERQSNKSQWDEAMRKIDENPQVQDELISELTQEMRQVTPVENAILMHRRIDLRNEYEKALHRWREAFESDDFVRAGEESQRVKDWSSKLADLEDITKQTGTDIARALQARKTVANEDFSLATMELQAMEAKGRNLTPDEHIQLIKANERINQLQNRINELESGREVKEVEIETTSTLKEVSKEAPKESKSKDFDLNREENLVSGIKAKIDKGQLNEITPLVQQLARVFWRRGVRERDPMITALHDTLKTLVPEFTKEQTQRAFSGYGDFKPLSKAEIDVGLRDLRGQTQQVLKLEALEARKPLEKTGQERRVPSDEERRLIKQVNELKRKYGVVVTDPATQLKSALASRKTYYEHRISDLKHEIETRQRIVKTKSPSPRDAELDAMIAEHDRLKAEHDSIFPKREMTDEQRIKVAIAAAERNLAHWEVRLENADKGVFDASKPEGRKVTSPELENIQAQAAAIREHVKELKDLANPKKTKEEIALQSLKTRMATQTAQFKERIAKGDFAKRERKPVTLDVEGNRLKAELDTVKQEFNTRMEQDRWARMSVFDKAKRKLADTYDNARALLTTGEFSFILRQGKMFATGHPIRTAKALPDAFRALVGNEKRVRELELSVLNDPLAIQARADKLFLDEHGSRLSRAEEILMGRLVGNIPIVRNFNNAARVFLNRIRFDLWKSMRKSMAKSGTSTPAEGRQIAMFVNESTGRGGLGKLEAAAVPLARIMFSPRYYASRLQLAAGHSLWGGTMRTRRIIATEYARSLIGLGLYYTALRMYFSDPDNDKMGEIGTDPRSTDFGKVKIGDSRLDPLAGLSQVMVLASRTTTGEKVTGKGEVQAIRGPEVKFGGDKWSDIVARHLRGKLHPVPSSIANLFDGTDLGGEEATIINQTKNMLAPITYMDIYAALKEQDLDDGAALALLALLGEGVQTYNKTNKVEAVK